jgi:hypothetical protein
MFHHLDTVGLQECLGCIKHGIVGFARRIGVIIPGLEFFGHLQGMAGLGQVGFHFRGQVHRAIPSWATFR